MTNNFSWKRFFAKNNQITCNFSTIFWTGVSRGIIRGGVLTTITFIVAHFAFLHCYHHFPHHSIDKTRFLVLAFYSLEKHLRTLIRCSSDLPNLLKIPHFKNEYTMVSFNDILVLPKEFLTNLVIRTLLSDADDLLLTYKFIFS